MNHTVSVSVFCSVSLHYTILIIKKRKKIDERIKRNEQWYKLNWHVAVIEYDSDMSKKIKLYI